MKQYTASCRCAAIHCSISKGAMNSVLCYCKQCQACMGSGQWYGLCAPTEKFKFTKSSPGAFLPVGDSGQDIIFIFALPAVGADVTVGNFYSVAPPPIIGDHKCSAEMAIYMASAAKWANFPECVKKFKILPPTMGACLPSKPIVRCPIGLEV
jgi:hypothetical protein